MEELSTAREDYSEAGRVICVLRPNIIMLQSMRSLDGQQVADWSREDLEPIMLFTDRDMRVYPFFTELLFTPGRSTKGRFYCDLYAGYQRADKQDWEEWAEFLFQKDKMLDAAAAVGTMYLQPQTGIWLRLPYPVIDTGNMSINLTRKAALFDWIGYVLYLWELYRPSSQLALRGFAWGRESIPVHDVELVTQCNELIRDLGFETLWMANYRSLHVADWRKMHFSQIVLYPNYTGNTEYGVQWLSDTALFAALNHMGIQMVMGQGKLYHPDHFRHYCEFMKQYLQQGGSGPILYRFPKQSLTQLYRNRNKQAYRSVYRSMARLKGGRRR